MAKEIINRINKIPRRKLTIVIVIVVIALIALTASYIFFLTPSSTFHTTTTLPITTPFTTATSGPTQTGISTSRSSISSSSASLSAASFNQTEDYDLWVKPYLAQLATIEAVLTQSYNAGTRNSYGYDSALGLTCGGNVEPSSAINVNNGYNNACVLIDNNLEGGASLDYFASVSSILNGEPGFNQVNLEIYTNTRSYLAQPFYGIGPCSEPFAVYSYPSSFTLLDMREAEYGFAGPYATQLLQPGIQLGGIGTLTCNGFTEEGQIWYLENFDNPDSTMIVTELPSETALNTTSDLQELSFVIDRAVRAVCRGQSSVLRVAERLSQCDVAVSLSCTPAGVTLYPGHTRDWGMDDGQPDLQWYVCGNDVTRYDREDLHTHFLWWCTGPGWWPVPELGRDRG